MPALPKLNVQELTSGGGVPIVLLHAFPFDHRMWVEAAAALPAHVRALAIDLPGQGFSELGTIPASMEMAAEAVYRTLKDAGVANAIVVGISMGGYVALALAERHPAFVSGLGLVDTKSTADPPHVYDSRLQVAREMERESTLAPVLAMYSSLLGETSQRERRHLLPTLDAWVHGQSPRCLAWAFRTIASRIDRTDVLTNFTEPVAVVVGAEDSLSPLSDSEHMAKAARDATLTVIPGAGHLSPIENPLAVAAAL
ncbi:MAG: alpha/beta hydrolase, partial [Promicromonosporaceae bacterium]|nr:alpha/beta hydrolase [Promicromonosporaceae bacterium]